ncbi:zona pellucida sperm-binding protein 4-like [Neoarius graeffei]|uniref:zona pellucida sperm-binding protein 4-like n=1 Tax=Neoarius graeffei TaxID=443677 RepID=UPI00298BED9C|nr:zona pellucida sperm-binding protein 4-like [Neoarius graeffei]
MASTGLSLVLFLVSNTFASLLPVKLPPQGPWVSLKPTLQTPGQVDKCQVQDYERVPCGEPGIKATPCNAINCCFDRQGCYYGKIVTVQCTLDGQFVVVVARDVTVPRISLDSISLLGGNAGPCSPVDSNTAFAIYQFPVTACGTTMKVELGYVVYENKMLSSYEVGVGPRGSITRDTHYEFYFQCKYSGVGFGALAIETSSNLDPLPVVASGPFQVELRLGKGLCVTKGCVEEQVAYTSYYSATDHSVTKVLREPVYVEVHIAGRTDPNIILVLGNCWATTSPNPYSLPQWDLLVNGCPSEDDHYLTKLIPVTGASGLAYPTHYRRFVLKMFTFVDQASVTPLLEMLYIHCSTSVCLPSTQDSCEPMCTRKRDLAITEEGSPGVSGMVSSGGVIFTQAQKFL